MVFRLLKVVVIQIAFPAFLHDEVDPSSTEAEQQRAKQQRSNGDESNEDGTAGPQRRFGDPQLPMESDGNCKCWYKLYGCKTATMTRSIAVGKVAVLV